MIKAMGKLCILAALAASSPVWAEESGWVISEADGQVSVQRGGKGIYGAAGTKLQIGDVIRTSKAARAVLARDDEFVIVSPNENVRIAQREENGTIGQIFEYLGSMLTTDDDQPRFRDTQVAAVVKGYGGGLEGFAAKDGEPKPKSGDSED